MSDLPSTTTKPTMGLKEVFLPQVNVSLLSCRMDVSDRFLVGSPRAIRRRKIISFKRSLAGGPLAKVSSNNVAPFVAC